MCQENKKLSQCGQLHAHSVVTTAPDIDGGGNGALYICAPILL